MRLRGGYILVYKEHRLDAEGKVSEVHCEFVPGTIGQNAPEGIKCRTAIHWVDAETSKDASVILYDRLFTEENPDAHPEGYEACLNADSLQEVSGVRIEPAAAELPTGSHCQFERVGYFFSDPVSHNSEAPVFNRTVALRDSWGKKK